MTQKTQKMSLHSRKNYDFSLALLEWKNKLTTLLCLGELENVKVSAIGRDVLFFGNKETHNEFVSAEISFIESKGLFVLSIASTDLLVCKEFNQSVGFPYSCFKSTMYGRVEGIVSGFASKAKYLKRQETSRYNTDLYRTVMYEFQLTPLLVVMTG